MSSLNFIGGEKGGVGKSVVARLLAQYFIDRGWPFTGFDTDRSHTSFARFYADYAAPVLVDSYEAMDRIVSSFEVLADPPAPSGEQWQGHGAQHQGSEGAPTQAVVPRVIVDLAAQTAAPLARWIHDSDLLAVMAELGVTVNFWHIADGGQDSIELLDRLLKTYGEAIRIVVVKNHGRGSDFHALESSPAMERALAQGAFSISLGALHDASMSKIDRQNRSFWGAVHNRSGQDVLGLLERQRVKSWLQKSYEAFDTLPL